MIQLNNKNHNDEIWDDDDNPDLNDDMLDDDVLEDDESDFDEMQELLDDKIRKEKLDAGLEIDDDDDF